MLSADCDAFGLTVIRWGLRFLVVPFTETEVTVNDEKDEKMMEVVEMMREAAGKGNGW
jgi:hypothetical protein